MVLTRSLAKKQNTFDSDRYNELVAHVPGIGREIKRFVGPVRNGYTNEQLLAPALLRKQIAIEAVKDWYEFPLGVCDLIETDPMLVILCFRIYCYVNYQG